MTASAWIAAIAACISLISVSVSVSVAVFSARNAARQTALAQRATELQRQALEAAAQPYVWVDLWPDESHAQLMRLVAVNQGPTVATDVHITVEPPLPDGPHTGAPAGSSGRLASMPPGRTVSWTVGNGGIWTLFEGDGPTRYRVTVTANGPYGPVKLEYDLDVADYAHAARIAPGTLFGVTERPQQADQGSEKLPGG